MRQGLAGEISYQGGNMGSVGARGSFALKGLMLAAALLALAAFAAPAVQADERVLDATLSLVGGCIEPEALDPVEDPGCPTTPPSSAHPPAAFAVPMAVTTDFYGNIYVANFGKKLDGSQGRIDIFTPEGVFISELKLTAPMSLAVDSVGTLYVIREVAGEGEGATERRLFRLAPTAYEPAAGKIEYGGSPVPVPQAAGKLSLYSGIAINIDNDHLFANYGGGGVVEYSSAAEGNAEVGGATTALFPYGMGIAVDAARDLLYAVAGDERVDIFDLTKTDAGGLYEKVGTIEESAVPPGNFGGYLSVAVDEGNGNIFLLDGKLNVAYQFAADGSYLATIEHGFLAPFGAEIGVDNGPFSPNGALSGEPHYLFIPSGKTGTGHSYAFEESASRPPEIKSTTASGVSETEAEFLASVNTGNLATSYTFEYTTQESFEAEGFAAATVAGAGELPAGNLDDEASAPATGLQAGTRYRFRIVAENEKGSDELEGAFSTYPSFTTTSGPCGNELFRAGLSKLLPDCRAYELVTPADTNGRAPVGVGQEGGWFTTRQVAPSGDKLPFRVEGGTLPRSNGTGSYLGDPFVASRSATGWNTAFTGPSAAEAVAITPGGVSPDVGYSFWTAENKGSALVEGKSTSYLRYPDGHFQVLGEGSIATDPGALGFLISEAADHVIFGVGYGASASTAIQIEPDGAPSGNQAIYDRTPDGVVHVVSLKPGDTPLEAGESAVYQGASLDGKGVAFTVGNTLYLRYQNDETYEIGNVDFAGVAEGGNRIFFVEGGRLWRFDALTGERTSFSDGTVTPVIVSPDGSTAYFTSTAILSSEANPNGAVAGAGQQNLYVSREGEVRFVGTVTERDVKGRFNGTRQVDGIGLWMTANGQPEGVGRLGIDPARSTPNGDVLLFQSRAPLDGYDPDDHAQIYRYDAMGETLHCLSCNPTEAAATSDATLQSENREGFALFLPHAWLRNLRPDGRRAIFQSSEPLVPGDTDGRQDVYEWEAEGVGSCLTPDGCISLISSGHSARNEYLWAVSESGDDVFFITSDLLLPADQDETPSIYDARVGGGFPESPKVECQGEGCRPQLSLPPAIPAPLTPPSGDGDNIRPPRHCGKGKRKVRRNGKVRCVKKKKGKHPRHRAGSNPKGGSK
jgi:hypothetical protein